MDTQQTNKSKQRLVIIAIAAVVAAIIVIVTIVFAVLGTKKQSQTATTASDKQATVATKDQIKEDMAKLDAGLKQSAADSAALKAAINEKPTKVGN